MRINRSAIRVLGLALLFVAFFPVRFVMQCSYGPPGGMDLVGNCSHAGESLVGIPIPTAVMGLGGGLLFVAVLMAPFLYVGYRLDRRDPPREEQ